MKKYDALMGPQSISDLVMSLGVHPPWAVKAEAYRDTIGDHVRLIFRDGTVGQGVRVLGVDIDTRSIVAEAYYPQDMIRALVKQIRAAVARETEAQNLRFRVLARIWFSRA